jgi:hypothetical protein
MSFGKEVKETGRLSTLILVGFTIIALGISGICYGLYFVLWPANEQVRYNTFKQSQSYNDGMTTDLADLKRSYDAANPDQQAALRGVINARFASYDANRLPPELGSFLHSIRGF